MAEMGKYGCTAKTARINVMEKLKNNELVLGATLNIPDPAIVEIMALAGFDFIWIDAEHNPFDAADLRGLIRAADACGIATLVRTPRRDLMTSLLDFGACGIMVPHVRSAEEAKELVDIVRYYPVGRRGYCDHGRAHRYGTMDFGEYRKEAQTDTFLVCQIEDKEGLENMEEICAVPGIDVICPGPGDISQTLGHIGEFSYPGVIEARDQVIACARKNGKECMIPCGIQDVWPLHEMGVGLIAIGDDKIYLLNGFREKIEQVRAAKPEK